MLADQAQRLGPARRGDHPHAGALEQPREDAPVHGAVIDDERHQVLARRQPRIERRLGAASPSSVRLRSSSAQTSGRAK